MTRRDKITAWLIGIGLVISVIHQPDQPLIDYIFLPQLGALLLMIVPVAYLIYLKKEDITLGSKWLWIPLAIITLSITVRPLYALITGQSNWGMKVEWSLAGYGLSLFVLYIASRRLGTEIFKPFTVAVVIASLSCIIFGAIQGSKTGGIISYTNYDMATGFLVFGTLVSSLQSRWWLSTIALAGLIFTGAYEAVLLVGVLSIAILARRDFSKKILLPVGLVAVTLITLTASGTINQLYLNPMQQKIELWQVANGQSLSIARYSIADRLSFHRLWGYQQVFEQLKPLGNGYNVNNFYYGIPHNVPLIIVHQIGIVAAIAWCFAIGHLLIKTKWKYAWIGFIAMGALDHFTWTQAAPWFWALAGVSSSSNIANDFIFKEVLDEA